MKKPFDEEMRELSNGLGKSIAIKAADILKVSYADLVSDTAFLTGQLMSNWIIGIGETNYDVEYFPENHTVTEGEALEKSKRQLPKLDEFELGTVIHFFNNIDYAQAADTNSRRRGFVSRGLNNINKDLLDGLTEFFKTYTYSEVPF